ncbi:MAG: alpha-mannosidase 2c1, partial [Spirochaetales bacterium]|nr:alpha-mannosidase 2c1 [Spirochaetales bacterium]
MQNQRIYKRRIQQFIDRIYEMRYTDQTPLNASFTYHKDTPIPYKDALKAKYKPIAVGKAWGQIWGCSWFKFEGKIPASLAGKEVMALIDIDGEGCVFVNGAPERGITYKAGSEGPHLKRRVPIANSAKKDQLVSILVEGGANSLFGRNQIDKSFDDAFYLKQAELVVFHRDVWELALDMKVLFELAGTLEENSPRAHKILRGLNDTANSWNDGKGIAECRKITQKLLAVRANASDTTVWSIGHAHIDLGWLWPIRETRRKGGRTFTTALRLMEEYPEYKFGASQPQLYKWVKEDYPSVYEEVKASVKKGKWELQGAMWVEPDMNITGGEALVRQCIYGKAFYKDEFGKDVRNLWLPDVFGYSAALPQILKKSGVDIFMTQKISWNEMNIFPHHTFNWEGIDGTEILTHFLPTNNYNLENTPKQLLESQKRFAQSDVQDDFLNLYGIGDGGGGPSRMHIEYGKRLQNSEGSPKVKFAFAEEFFKKIAKTPASKLPKWAGELYLELHRGTLTTQGRMKKYNRRLELQLRDVEMLAALAGTWDKKGLDQVWEDTLLNQFHDILPGSSITWVYKDAHALSEKNLTVLKAMKEKALDKLFGGKVSGKASTFAIMNTLSWGRKPIVALPAPGAGAYTAVDSEGNELAAARDGATIYVETETPAIGYTTVELKKGGSSVIKQGVSCTENSLQNSAVRIKLANDGTISS